MDNFERELGYFEMWKAKLPRGLPVQDMNTKLSGHHKDWWTHTVACLSLYQQIVKKGDSYVNTSLIMSAMGKYYIHPGTKRYILESICDQFPQSDVLIMNRWGTTEEQILKDFPDAKRHREDFNGWFNYKDIPKKDVYAHGLKTDRKGGKDMWLHAARKGTNIIAEGHYDHPLIYGRCIEFWYQGKKAITIGRGEATRVDVYDVYHFTKILLREYTDARLLQI